LYKNTASLDWLPLLFRKKARSAHLFGCKRPHDGSLSLPPFCDSAPHGAIGIIFERFSHVAASLLVRRVFCIKTRLRFVGCRSFTILSCAKKILIFYILRCFIYSFLQDRVFKLT